MLASWLSKHYSHIYKFSPLYLINNTYTTAPCPSSKVSDALSCSARTPIGSSNTDGPNNDNESPANPSPQASNPPGLNNQNSNPSPQPQSQPQSQSPSTPQQQQPYTPATFNQPQSQPGSQSQSGREPPSDPQTQQPGPGFTQNPQDQRQGFSSNINPNKYKTAKCRHFENNGACMMGDKCNFAHGDSELREPVQGHSQPQNQGQQFHGGRGGNRRNNNQVRYHNNHNPQQYQGQTPYPQQPQP